MNKIKNLNKLLLHGTSTRLVEVSFNFKKMKKLYIFIIALGFTVSSTAQNSKKNELQFGLTGSYFNYEKKFKWHRTRAIPLPTISYWRKAKIGKVGFEYNWLFFTTQKKTTNLKI